MLWKSEVSITSSTTLVKLPGEGDVIHAVVEVSGCDGAVIIGLGLLQGAPEGLPRRAERMALPRQGMDEGS